MQSLHVTRLHIAPNIMEFHDDEDDNDPHLCVSDLSSASDISNAEKDSELKRFTDTFQMTQIPALKSESKNKRETYSKWSKETLNHCVQVRINLALKGFLPVDEYIRIKGNWNQEKLTSELNNIINIVPDESEEGTDEEMPVRETCTRSSINGISDSNVESEGSLPVQNDQLRLACHMESKSSGDNDVSGNGDLARQSVSENNTPIGDDKEIRTASECLERLRHDSEAILAHQTQGIPSSTY
jgi:hypothetical protein